MCALMHVKLLDSKFAHQTAKKNEFQLNEILRENNRRSPETK